MKYYRRIDSGQELSCENCLRERTESVQSERGSESCQNPERPIVNFRI